MHIVDCLLKYIILSSSLPETLEKYVINVHDNVNT